jgi:hypothetical protein
MANSGFGLPSSDGSEGNQEFVVHCTVIVEEGTNNFLDSVLTGIIKKLRCITFRSELHLGTI